MKAIQHLAMNCRDIRRSEAFYAKHFGFRRARTFNAGTGGEFVLIRLGATCLELFAAPAGAPAVEGEPAVGFKHLAFEVPDLEAMRKQLAADGVAVGDTIDCTSILSGMKVCFFKDPDGNLLEIMQGYKDQV